MNAAADAAQTNPAEGDGVVVAKHYEVLPGVRLPQYDSPVAQAFAARDRRRSSGRRLFALVCGVEPHPRLDVISGLARTASQTLLAPERWGIATWPPAQQERFFILFEQRGSERVLPAQATRWEQPREDNLVKTVLEPLITALVDMSRGAVSHRAVRLDNLYWADETRGAVVLGECVSAPPAFLQPAVYEPVESILANPLGRGAGTIGDDLYALGVLLALFLNGRDPCAGMTDDEVAKAKIETGTFALLFDGSRPILTMMEPLRGLLADNARERWGLEELVAWRDGRKQTPKQLKRVPKAQRQFEFHDAKYDNLRELSRAMGRHWDSAIAVVREPAKLLDWLERGLNDRDRPEGLFEAASSVLSRNLASAGAADAALSKLLILFDPKAPIRYKEFAAHLDGLGLTFASIYQDEARLKSLREVMRAKLPGVWLELQTHIGPAAALLKKSVEITDLHLGRRGWGFGVERCLYELNPTWPCQSPILKDRLVCTVPQLIVALERIAAEGPPDSDPVDAHVTAFCAARLKQLPLDAYKDLGSHEDDLAHRIAMLRLLAAVQHLMGGAPLPGIARWMVRLVGAVVESFHNKPYKQLLAEEMSEMSEEGRLADLLALADNDSAKDRDSLGFRQATRLFAEADQEIQWLKDGGLTSEQHIRRGSNQAATLISAVLSGVAVLSLTLMAVM